MGYPVRTFHHTVVMRNENLDVSSRIYIFVCAHTEEGTMKGLATIFKTLSDESRLRIYNLLLAAGELCVCDIEETLRFTQTKVSRHLAYLKKAGLVMDRRQGLWMLYSITEPKDEEQKQLLRVIADGLRSNPLARKDARLLARNIRRGCCTTFNVLKPNAVPVALELNRS
jgi:ArsR family transcriptional regulator